MHEAAWVGCGQFVRLPATLHSASVPVVEDVTPQHQTPERAEISACHCKVSMAAAEQISSHQGPCWCISGVQPPCGGGSSAAGGSRCRRGGPSSAGMPHLTSGAYVLGGAYTVATLVCLLQLGRIHFVAKAWTTQKALHACLALTALCEWRAAQRCAGSTSVHPPPCPRRRSALCILLLCGILAGCVLLRPHVALCTLRGRVHPERSPRPALLLRLLRPHRALVRAAGPAVTHARGTALLASLAG